MHTAAKIHELRGTDCTRTPCICITHFPRIEPFHPVYPAPIRVSPQLVSRAYSISILIGGIDVIHVDRQGALELLYPSTYSDPSTGSYPAAPRVIVMPANPNPSYISGLYVLATVSAHHRIPGLKTSIFNTTYIRTWVYVYP